MEFGLALYTSPDFYSFQRTKKQHGTADCPRTGFEQAEAGAGAPRSKGNTDCTVVATAHPAASPAAGSAEFTPCPPPPASSSLPHQHSQSTHYSPPSPSYTTTHHWPIAAHHHHSTATSAAAAATTIGDTSQLGRSRRPSLRKKQSAAPPDQRPASSSSSSLLHKHTTRKLSLRGLPLQTDLNTISPSDRPFPTTPTSPLGYTLEGNQHHDQPGRRPSAAPTYPPRHDSISAAKPGRSGNMTSTSDNTLPLAAAQQASSVDESAGPPSTTSSTPLINKPFIVRNSRGFLPDPTVLYPLPVDLAELHRQSLRTLLLFQLFGGPVTSSAFADSAPKRVLEVGCGSGFWSMMCHRYFAQYGYSNISFTGFDIAPLATFDSTFKPDKDMQWRFVQHDIRRMPWPFADDEFDLIICKDMALAVDASSNQEQMDEYLRILAPGGVLECWESDQTLRMLRPHVPRTQSGIPAAENTAVNDSSESDEEDEATKLGAYVMTSNTPLSAPLNTFLVEYNGWISKALQSRGLNPVPTTAIGPTLLQESETLTDIRSKRLAVPLSEIRWEREGVGGVVTKDGKSYIDSMKGKGRIPDLKGKSGGKMLSAAQAALRRTALETVVGQIQAFETLLRDVTGKSQDEWDGWLGKMMNDLLREGGTSWGECLEVGAWSARKRGGPPQPP